MTMKLWHLNPDMIMVKTRRPINPVRVAELVESIKRIGLLNPPSVVLEDLHKKKALTVAHLVAGAHRLEAWKRAKPGQPIPCIPIASEDEDYADLAEIDENLLRQDLEDSERALLVKQRKALEAKIAAKEAKPGPRGPGLGKGRGGRGKKEKGAGSERDLATKTGVSRNTAARDLKRIEALGEDVVAKLTGTSLSSAKQMNALIKLPEPERDALVARAVAGEKVSALPPRKKKNKPTAPAPVAPEPLVEPPEPDAEEETASTINLSPEIAVRQFLRRVQQLRRDLPAVAAEVGPKFDEIETILEALC